MLLIRKWESGAMKMDARRLTWCCSLRLQDRATAAQVWTTTCCLAVNLTEPCSDPAEEGNILWDCINVLQPEVARQIHGSGGIRAIAISHPHFFGGIATWAEEFDAPVYIHEKDKHFVTEPNSHIQPWSGVCAFNRDSSDMSESYTHSTGATPAAASKHLWIMLCPGV